MAQPEQLKLLHITKPVAQIAALGCGACGRPFPVSPFVTKYAVCGNPTCRTSYKFDWVGTIYMPQYRFEAIKPEEKEDGKE